MIVAPQPIAVEEGARVLREGGNAIDAAVTAALAQGVTDPTNCGLGGWGVIHVRPAGRARSEVVEFYSLLPGRMPPDIFANDVIGEPGQWNVFPVKAWANNIGYKAVGVPGTVKGLHEALTRYGTWSWSKVLQPAIRWAEEGVPVDFELAGRLSPLHEPWSAGPRMLDRLNATPAAAALYTREGRPLKPGELMVHADAARTMRRLADEGADDFYRGAIARAIAADFARNGGFIAEEDLRDYRTRTGEPIAGTYRGYRIETSRPPTGGVTVVEILNILEGYDLAGMGHNSADYIHVVTEAFRAAFADRIEHVGDPEFVDVPLDRLLSKAHAAAWRQRLSLSRRLDLPPPVSLRLAGGRGATTHLSAIDVDGNAVSLTHTLALSSAGVVTPGLGFLYNNSVALFNPYPGHPNSMAGGRMRATGAAPTIVYRDGKPVLVVGAPGGHGIITGVVQTILNVIDHGMTATEAVSASRFHCEHGALQVETRIPGLVRDELARRGHRVDNTLTAYGYTTGAVQLVMADPATGAVSGAADPRRGGMVLKASSLTAR
ncbi:MAG: gamma-glutamyltransferase [Chloroflexi bacterium]|nr:gamma-glutamyltransferase [Chloroflexota bacterium]